MTWQIPYVDWSVQLPGQLDDRDRDALAERLGLSFHSYNVPFAHTVAHRFVDDDEPDTLLRVVRRSADDHAIQLVALGADTTIARSAEVRSVVLEAVKALRTGPAPPLRVIGHLGERLSELVENMRGVLLGVRASVEPVLVLGPGDRDDAPGTGVPYEISIPEETKTLLAADLQSRVLIDDGVMRVWLSGTWTVTEPSRILLGAVTDRGQIVTAEAAILPGTARVRLELSWTDPTPPEEVLLAVTRA